MKFKAIIVAAGTGTRAGGVKHWRQLGGKSVLEWSIDTFLDSGAQDIVIVVSQNDLAYAQKRLIDRSVTLVLGGDSRPQSVYNALAHLQNTTPADTPILIHDAARPLVSQTIISNLLDALKTCDGAIPVMPVVDSLKSTLINGEINHVPRHNMLRAQTPQATRFGIVLDSYRQWPSDQEATDDAQILAYSGHIIRTIPGTPQLHKFTVPEDLLYLETLLNGASQLKYISKSGFGIDAHRLGSGDGIWLCGIKLPSTQSLIGHSDADVALHALTDALLGACALGDIGDHFPPTDPQWKGAASSLFLKHACGLVAAKGGIIDHIDLTIICETPKIKPYRDKMRNALCTLLNMPLDSISLKATTTEGMGFTGRAEGIVAQAIATLRIPHTDQYND